MKITSSAICDLLLACSIATILSGCGTLPNGRAWGEDATLRPGLARIRSAALHAVKSPATWIPAAGAAVFAVDHFDRRVSDWASEKTPVFGSKDNAENISDDLFGATIAGAVLTAIATPSGPDPVNKLKGIGVEAGAGAATAGITQLLKVGVGRTRPNGGNDRSFPSGHSAGAFSAAALGGENVDTLPWSDGAKIAVRTGFYVLAGGTAWARVEAREHFPSDVLAGAALGNFISIFVYDAFLGLDQNGPVDVSVSPEPKGLVLAVHVQF